MMLDSVRIEAYPFYFRAGSAIVSGTDRVIQDEFGPALRRIDLDREHGRRSDQDSIGTLFGHNERPFFDAQTSTELRRQHDCAAAANLARRCVHHLQNNGQSEDRSK